MQTHPNSNPFVSAPNHTTEPWCRVKFSGRNVPLYGNYVLGSWGWVSPSAVAGDAGERGGAIAARAVESAGKTLA